MNIRDYYDQVTSVDIGEIAEQLLGDRIKSRSVDTWECDCPVHQSTSGRSLKVSLHKQAFHCFGCRQGGDVLQFVEFIQSGTVTKGQKGEMTESHQKARDFLADQIGMPRLGGMNRTTDQLDVVHRDREAFETLCKIRNHIVVYYHKRLLARPDVLSWFMKKYAISLETVKSLQIGFTENEPKDAPSIYAVVGKNWSQTGLAHTGFFRKVGEDRAFPHFDQRLLFPYWSKGNVVFGIGRKTPWTPVNQYESGKYKKSLVYDRQKRPWVSPTITNSHLFNEDVLTARPEFVVITEGITDAISLMERDIPVISPVTVRLKREDWKRVLPKLAKVKTVYICQDNEISNVGLDGALDTGDMLLEAKINCKLVTLSLGEPQRVARKQLKEKFGITDEKSAKEIKATLATLGEEATETARHLIDQAKMDVNEWFRLKRTREDFLELLKTAETPFEVFIRRLKLPSDDLEKEATLKPVFQKLNNLPMLAQKRGMDLVKRVFGINKTQQTKLMSKEKKASAANYVQSTKKGSSTGVDRNRYLLNAERYLLRGVLGAQFADMKEFGCIDYSDLAETAFGWFKIRGASFFKTSSEEPLMVFEDKVLWMASKSDVLRNRYYMEMYKHTGIDRSNTAGRVFYSTLRNLVALNAVSCDPHSWIQSKRPQYKIFFNLSNERNELVQIDPSGINIIKNGANPENIILSDSEKMKPIHFDPNVNLKYADDLVEDLLFDNFTCEKIDRYILISWFSCFLLLDFAGTKPIMRCEGGWGSGKSSAAKMISTLLFGDEQQKLSTTAANYSDAARSPLLALDNIETADFNEALKQFLLCGATGVIREKRKHGTDIDTIKERVNCLIAMTGIEPLGASLGELLSRFFVIKFDRKFASPDFLQQEVLAKIQEHRNVLLSAIIVRTQRVLKWLELGYQRKVMKLFREKMGHHEQDRANDFLTLMYLMTLALDDCEEPDITAYLGQFLETVRRLNRGTKDIAKNGNELVMALEAVFKAYRTVVALDEQEGLSAKSHVADFHAKYNLNFKSEIHLSNTSAELFRGLKTFCRDRGLPFMYRSPGMVGARWSNDATVLKEAGFEVSFSKRRSNMRVNEIVYREDADIA